MSQRSDSRASTKTVVYLPVLLVAALMAMPGIALGETPTVDGFVRDPVTGVVEEPYVVKGITYTQDQTTGVFAGILYRAEDDQNLYFAFEQSVHINDNTYGANAIGWGGKGHKLDALLRSEHAEIRMYDTNGTLILDFFLDYASRHPKHTNNQVLCLGVSSNGADGALILGSASDIAAAGSSLAWNFNNAAPTYPNKDNTNPPRVPTNTYDSGTTADPSYPWIYPLVYEWAVRKSAFGAAGFGGLEILEVHNSPFKPGAGNPVPVPILTVSKLADPPSGSGVGQNQTITYTITYANEGTGSLTNVVITDLIDPNLDNVVPLDGGTCSGNPCGPGSTLTWNIGTVGPGASGSVQFTAVVTPQPDATHIYNTAQFTATELQEPMDTNTTVHHILPIPVLAVTKSCPAEAGLGDPGEWSITVSSLGNTTATNVVVTDDYDETLVTVLPGSISDGGTVENGVITWNLGDLVPFGPVVTLTYSGTFAQELPPGQTSATATNTVTAQSTEGATDTASCDTTITAPDLDVSKSCPPELIAGEDATYTIAVSNVGEATAANVVLVDNLPTEVSFVSATPAPSNIDGQTLTWNLGDLAAGASVTVSVTVNVQATAGTATNSVHVTTTSLEGGEDSANNVDSCASTIKAPDVTVSKECPVDMIAGEQATYTVTVGNAGTATAKNVYLTDTLPDGVSFVSATPPPDTTSGNVLTWSLGDLAVGASVSVAITVTVDATAGTPTNEALVTTDSVEGGEGVANNSDNCSSTIVAPDVVVSKECPVDMIAGTQAGYTVNVSNAGTSAAKNVVVTDVLPAEVSFVSATPAPTTVSGNTLTWNLGDLVAGGGLSITINVQVDATAGTATNTASATTDSVEGGEGTANNSASCSSTVVAPDVAVSKECPVDMIVGTQASYTVTMSNTGTSAAKNVVLTDVLPPEVSFVDATPAPTSVAGNTATWNLGDLAAGASVTVTINVTVDATAGTATNTASATTDSVEGGEGVANNDDSCSSAVKSPDVVVSKQCPVDMIAGDPASYTVTVSNAGTSAAKNVVLTDTLPAQVSFVSATPAPTSVSGSVVTWNLGDLAAGGSVVITINVTVDATAGTATNTAAATTDSVEGGEGVANNDDSCSSTVKSPDVVVSKECPVDMIAGTQASYTVTVSNAGTSPARNVVLTDTLPSEVSFESATPAPTSVSGSVLTWNLGDLAAGGSVVVTINVNVDATAGTATNTASATTDSVEGGDGTANNSASCSSTVKSPDVVVAKECPVDMIAGDPASYTVTVSNAGTSAATNVVLTDTLPAEVSFVSATPAPTSVSGSVLTWSLGDLAAGGSVTITINVTVDATAGTATNTASATTDSVEGGEGTANNSASCSSTVKSPDVVVSKDCPIDMIAGDDASYTVTVSNAGTSAARNVVVTDVLPPEVSFVSATPAPTSVDGNTVTWSLGDIAVGGSVVTTITVNVDATAGTATNTVSAATDSVEGGEGTANNSASCSSTVKSPDVVVAKECPADMIAGDPASYTVTVSNAGTSAARNVVVTDVLPAEVSFDSATPTPTSVAGNTVTWNLGDIAVGGSIVITINVTVDATTGTATNTASATTDSVEGGEGTANNSASCSSTVKSPDVVVSKDCPTDMIAGEQAAYTVTVSNAGTATARNVYLTDTLPAEVSFVSATPVPDSTSGGILTWGLGDIAVGASVEVAITVTVDAAAGTATNSVLVTTDSVEGGQGAANNSDECSSAVKSPDVVVSKECPADMISGDPASYTVTVSNAGTGTAKNVVLTDVLPPEVSYASATPTPTSVTGGTVTWNLGDIAVGGSIAVTITVDVDATAGTATNTASATTDSVEGGEGTANNSDSCSSAINAPDVVVSKECPIDMIAGDQASYTVTVSNAGTSAARNVVLTDVLPAEVSFVDATPAETSVAGNTVTWNLGDIAVGGSIVVTITVDVDATAGTATNTASGATDSVEGGEGTANNSASCSSTVKSPDVVVSKDCPIDMIAGEQAGYTVTVSNAGTSAARNVVVTDVLPPEVSFVSATPAPTSVAGNTVTWGLGDIAVGGSIVVTVTVHVDATAGTATNTASATTDSVEGGEGTANNSASCSSTVRSPDVVVSKDCPIDMIAGEQAGYTVTVSNAGTSTAKNVVLTDVLPPEVSFVSASPAPTSVVGNTITWGLGDIAVGGSIVVTVTVHVDATAGTATNTASATTDSVEGGEGTANNSASCSSTVRSPDVVVSKDCPIDMIAGEQAGYTVTVSNAGTSAAKNVVLTDQLPPEVSFVGATPAPTSVVGNTITWSLGDIAVGGSVVITIDVSVDATGGIATNTTSATTDSVEGGEGTANNSDTCSSTVKGPDVEVSKDCPIEMIAGTQAGYTVTVSNVGISPAKNVVLTDVLPPEVSFVSATPAPTSIVGNTVTWSLGDIAVGGSAVITITVDVDATAGAATNTASVTTDSLEGGQGLANNTASCSSAVKSPDVVVSKDCPIDMISGDPASYTVTVSNAGTSPARNVVLTDVLPAEVSFVAATPAETSVAGNTVTWNLGDIAAGGSVVVAITVDVDATAGTATNTVSATTDSVEGGEGTANNSASCSSTVKSPDVVVSKDCPIDMISGTQASYTVTVSNAGTSAARNVVVTDVLPPEVSLVSATPAPTSVVGNTLTWGLGDIAEGGLVVITIDVNVDATGGTATNAASATTDSVEGGEGMANDSADCSSTIKAADVTVDSVCPSNPVASSTASFVVDFSNIGTADALDVVVTDVVPTGFFEDDTFTASADVGVVVVSGLTVTVNVGALAPTASGTLTITGTVDPSSAARGGYVNQATITTSSQQSDTLNDTDSCTTTLVAPVLTLSKSSQITVNTADLTNAATISAGEIVDTTDTSKTDLGVSVGSTIVYTLTYANTGDAAASGVVVSDTLPAGVAFVSASNGGAHAAGTVTWNIGIVAAGGSGSVTVTVKIGQ